MLQRASNPDRAPNAGRGKFKKRLRALLCCTMMAAGGANAGLVTLDTASLSGNAARLEINLLDGDGVFGNSALSAFGESISDPGQIIHDFIAGASLSFNLDFLFDLASGDSDLVVLNLLDPGTNFSLVDTDLDLDDAPVPYQDAVLACGIQSGACLTPTASNPAVAATFVPEPAGAALMALTGMLLLSHRRRTSVAPVF